MQRVRSGSRAFLTPYSRSNEVIDQSLLILAPTCSLPLDKAENRPIEPIERLHHSAGWCRK